MEEAQRSGRKRQRGMNKNRGSYRPPKSDLRLCTAVKQGKPCAYGDSCRFSHDVEAYEASRPPDLGELCPIYTLRGYCQFGVTCRFGLAHGGKNNPENASHEVYELNTDTYDLMARLRKRNYDFSIATAAVARWEAINQHPAQSKDGDEILASAIENVSGAVDGASDAITCDTTGEVDSATDPPEPAADESAAAQDSAPSSNGVSAMPSATINSDRDSHYALGSVVCKEKKKVDFRGKLVLAPLTTVGNLPFRRICKEYGADITCSEMALAVNLLQGQSSEWALLKRHVSEDVFGVQIAGNNVDHMTRVAQVLEEHVEVDYVDINMGCPIDLICNRGMGSALPLRPNKVQGIVRSMSQVLSVPLTVKLRMGYDTGKPTAHNLIPKLPGWGVAAVTLHGRSRQQRYTKTADWEYIAKCATESAIPLVGNGDAFSYEDLDAVLRADTNISSVMLARGALIKPWLFTEMKERRHWDISASERLDMLRGFVRNGLEHWGTDDMGVARTRGFLLEWLSFLHRYVPVGLLERVPPRIQEQRPLSFSGRNDLETLMASSQASDWVKISEMLLGPVPADFHFTPKHKSNADPSTVITSEG